MESTALSASKSKDGIIFISEAHEKFYYEKLKEVRYQDEYHKALCYCLGINSDTRKHIDSIYNFETGCVRPECLQESWQTSGSMKVIRMAFNLYCSELHTFQNHPFKVNDDKEMEELAESIREHGVLIPGIVRPRTEGGYELIAGHRRKHGSELAGKTEMPVIIRDYSDDEATIIMVDSNIQRETILPSEKAKAYALKYEALKHQGKRSGKSTLDQVGEASGENAKKVQRYLWLSRLSDQLLQMVDENRLGFSQGVDLSFLSGQSQQFVADAIEQSKCTVSMGQSAKLKEYEKQNELTPTVVRLILEEKNVNKRKVTLKMDKLSQYFGESYSSEEMENIILQLLDEWKKTQEGMQQ